MKSLNAGRDHDLKAKVLTETGLTVKILKDLKIAVAVLAMVIISVAAGRAQTLVLTGGSVVQYLSSQALTGVYPPTDNTNNGTISSWVVNDSAQDPSGYMFIYQVVNNGPDAIDQVELTGFNSSIVLSSAAYSGVTGLTLSGSLTPSLTGSFAPDGVTSGGAANFQSGNLPNNGGVSYFLVINTDVQSVSTSYGQVQDSFTAAGTILAPGSLSPVPEPSSSLMLFAGFACLGVFLRNRRAAGSNR